MIIDHITDSILYIKLQVRRRGGDVGKGRGMVSRGLCSYNKYFPGSFHTLAS